MKRIAIVVVVVLLAIQLIPVTRTNPAVDAAGSLLSGSEMPAEARATFQRSCQDCHSNRTAWPWYSHLAPVSWLIANDVKNGRRHLNLDRWNSYDLEQKKGRLTRICEELKSGEMPDGNYTMIHRGARLTEQERTMLCDWAEATRKGLGATGSGGHS